MFFLGAPDPLLMRNWLHSLTLRLAILSAIGWSLAGCAAPAHVGRPEVAASLEARTGHSLGPQVLPLGEAVTDLVDWADGLSEDEAVAIALWNNPAYQSLLADLEITRADLIQAAQLTNPDVITMFPLSAKQWEFTLMVPLDVLLLRPHRVAAAQLESQRVAERLVQNGLNVMRDVRFAYVDLALAEESLSLAEEALEWRAEIARIAEARLKAGAVAELDVAPMRLETVFGSSQVVQAQRDVELAREKLRFLLGAALTDTEVATTGLAEVPKREADVEALVAEAAASRPDVRALEIALAAASERSRLARYDYFNVAGALPDINSKGDKGFEAGPGLRMSLPVFHQNQGAIARAEAELERLRQQHAAQRDTVGTEVRQAYAQFMRAQEDLLLWREQAVPQAEAAAAAARKALQEDGVSLLLVLETTRQLLNARQQQVQAVGDVHRALAELERSVGRRLVDAAPRDEGHDVLATEVEVHLEEITP